MEKVPSWWGWLGSSRRVPYCLSYPTSWRQLTTVDTVYSQCGVQSDSRQSSEPSGNMHPQAPLLYPGKCGITLRSRTPLTVPSWSSWQAWVAKHSCWAGRDRVRRCMASEVLRTASQTHAVTALRSALILRFRELCNPHKQLYRTTYGLYTYVYSIFIHCNNRYRA